MVGLSNSRIGSSKMVLASGVSMQALIVDLGRSSIYDAGAIPDFESPELAVARTTHVACVFELLAKKGIPTHYLGREDDITIRVWECQVQSLPLVSDEAYADMIGLEILFRIRVSEKFCKRVVDGDVPHEKIHLPEGVELAPGVKFSRPFVEASTKWRKGGDVYLSDKEAAELAGVSIGELQEFFEWIAQAGQAIDEMCEATGYELDDGKFEVARVRATGKLFVIDGVSLDELGVRKGRVHYGKNLLRFYYRDNHSEWLSAFKAAQEAHPEDKSKWPTFPPLPRAIQDEHVSHYQETAANWSGWLMKVA